MSKYIGKKYETRDGYSTAEVVAEGVQSKAGSVVAIVLSKHSGGVGIPVCYHEIDGGLRIHEDAESSLDLIEVKLEAEKLYTWYYANLGSDSWWLSVRLYTEAQAAIAFRDKLYRRGPELAPPKGDAA